MNPFSNKQLKALRAVHLSQAEKEQMLSAIKAEMSLTPLPVAHTKKVGVRNESVKRYHVRRPHITNTFTKKIMPIALLITLLMGGTVSYAAESTLPGDTLYPVKIHVNENVRSAAAISPSAQAELEISLAERRLREAEALHGEGRLDASTKSELRGRFDEHSGRAKAEIESYSSEDKEGADRIRTDLKIKLGLHGDVLRVLEIEFEDEDGDDHESRGDNDDHVTISSSSDVSVTTRTEDRGREQDVERHESRSESDEDNRHSAEDSNDDEGDWGDDVNVGVTSSLGITIPTVVTKPTPSPTPAVTPTPSASAKTFTLAEVATHSNAQSCYTAVSGSVYDVTSYIPVHKGGMAAILGICGKDGTTFFGAQHAGQPKPETMLATFKIGTIIQ